MEWYFKITGLRDSISGRTMQQLSITRVQTADTDAVADLLVAQMKEHRIEQGRDALSQVVSSVLSDERYGFFLAARLGGEVVGVAYVTKLFSVEHGGPVGWLEELYVSPEHRQQGIGTALLSGVLEHTRKLGLVALDLEVDIQHQRAEALYIRFGFQRLPRSRWVRKLAPS
jgi:GNAT superfamily N-acetyltransferase